nr:DUF971 domain-containing protein [Anaerolineae bacterium]
MTTHHVPGLKPTNIILHRQNHQLKIEWNDGHTSFYDLNALREACPCATCRGGHEFMGAEHDPDLIALTPSRAYSVVNLNVAGTYALQIEWDDHHSAGFYTWEYLRRICPCENCQALRGADSE